MDPQQNMHFISLIPGMAPSRTSQPTPLPPGIGTSLSPMMIPLATSDTVVMTSFSQPPQTISLIQSIAPGGPRSAQVILPQGLAPPPDVIAVSAPAPVQPQVPPVYLYKCSTGGASGVCVCARVCVCVLCNVLTPLLSFQTPPPSVTLAQRYLLKQVSGVKRRPLWTSYRRPTLSSTLGRSKTHSAPSCPTSQVRKSFWPHCVLVVLVSW